MDRRFPLALLIGVSLVTLAGCRGVVIGHRPPGRVVVGHKKPGPPPHAPAHGHRRKHAQGAELRFDRGLGVYVVIDVPDVYFHDGWFVRFDGGAWQASAQLDGPWEVATASQVPPGLRAKYHAKKSKKKHPGPARGAR